jgi:nitric oxide reductase activation protein
VNNASEVFEQITKGKQSSKREYRRVGFPGDERPSNDLRYLTEHVRPEEIEREGVGGLLETATVLKSVRGRARAERKRAEAQGRIQDLDMGGRANSEGIFFGLRRLPRKFYMQLS